MNCAYHTHNIATVNCNGCGRSLCPACDHRIKGFPYCQECIVNGVDLLRHKDVAALAATAKKKTSPPVALLLSLFFPGLGAAYNGQTIKGIVHFLLFAALFQQAIISGGMPIFVLGFIGMWAYAGFDSWRTAQLIRAGITPDNAEDILTARISGNANLWGIVLVALGFSFVAQRILDIHLFISRFLLPLLMIGIGIHLLRSQLKRRSGVLGATNSDSVSEFQFVDPQSDLQNATVRKSLKKHNG
ncbi:MAG: hypothetical protein ACK5NT_11130 [Pyrinomonadaceae bacterium]